MDEYEGEEYRRIKVSVLPASGKNIECFTYAFKREYFSRLTKSDWSANEILNRKRPELVQQNPKAIFKALGGVSNFFCVKAKIPR